MEERMMKLECSVEELIKIVSANQTDTININKPLITSDIIKKLNQEQSQ